MSTLTDRLAACGADMDGAMERFINDEVLYAECFRLFLEDSNFTALGDALSEKDYPSAFHAAHTLKGVAGNMGLSSLYDAICEIVESLRHQDYSHLDTQYQAILNGKAAMEKLK